MMKQMKLIVWPVLLVAAITLNPTDVTAQKKSKQKKDDAAAASETSPQGKKYPSLLWEITGNGLKTPSYLFGTMHISNKMVFNLGDSFYNAIKSVDVVALEQNPELWQEELMNQDNTGDNFLNYGGLMNRYDVPKDRMRQSTFALSPSYEPKIELGLASEARMVNGILYRNNVGHEDFEEETYLDMFIFRLGHKLDKIVTGVEDYKESNKIVKEAYKDMYKDKKARQRSYNADSYEIQKNMEDAYRRGDLDAMDSLEALTVISDAFQEKFLYKRNEIQAHSIDTILQKHSLFVGVGAAHLPGDRGVIEMLRKKGYTLRPVVIGERNSEEKDKLEKIRVPVTFKTQFAEDSMFSVDIPGNKFYRYATYGQQNMVQYLDMPNGSYYMVTRIKTDAALLGDSPATVQHKTDSLLYENIPGKILSNKTITRNGYQGYDIVNRTRKGDKQRYNIFILPNEVVIFKISGLADYVTGGPEADSFFNSISFKKEASVAPGFTYEQPYGGFKIRFPAEPYYIAKDRNDEDRSEWISEDDKGNSFFVLKSTINQFDFLEEDTFELRLMETSFTDGDIFRDNKSSKFGSLGKYPVLNAAYTAINGDKVKARYIIQNNNYYVVGARYKTDSASASAFIESFAITPYNYGTSKLRTDSTIGYTVNSPVFYDLAKDSSETDDLQDIFTMASQDDDESFSGSSYFDMLNSMYIKSIGNDTTGEHISLLSMKLPKYTYIKDSADLLKSPLFIREDDSDFIVAYHKNYVNPQKWYCSDYTLKDTGCSRMILAKAMYKNGVLFYLVNTSDTIAGESPFVKRFFETFTPADTFKTFNPFEKKSALFFSEYFGTDTLAARKAKKSIASSLFDSTDLPEIQKAIAQLSWKDKNYLATKNTWIDVLGHFSNDATAAYLTSLYGKVKDTSALQNAILDALLNMKTQRSFSAFASLLTTDPPALTSDNDFSTSRYGNMNMDMFVNALGGRKSAALSRSLYGQKWSPLYDTLKLTAGIMPDLLNLISLDDYKSDIQSLLVYAVDSGYVKADDYKQYFTKFFLDAKQQLKKEVAKDEMRKMAKLNKKNNNSDVAADEEDDDDTYSFNSYRSKNDLDDYAVLLMPFWNKSDEVASFFNKMLELNDKELKMKVATVMIRDHKQVPDSIIQTLAEDDDYRLELYETLDDAKQLNLFPQKYRNQRSIAESVLKSMNYYGKIDTVSYLTRSFVEGKDYKGWVYFFKYKKSEDDNDWKIASSGLQPTDTSKINASFKLHTYNFTDFTDEVYTNEKEAAKSYQKILMKEEYSLRPSAAAFFNENDYDDDYDDQAIDMVKSRRYD